MKFVRVAAADDVGEEEAIRVELGEKPICLAKTGGRIYAVDDVCTHEYAEMHEGFVEGRTIECPRHGSQFDLETGDVLSLPAVEPLPTYEVRIEGDDVLVGIEE